MDRHLIELVTNAVLVNIYPLHLQAKEKYRKGKISTSETKGLSSKTGMKIHIDVLNGVCKKYIYIYIYIYIYKRERERERESLCVCVCVYVCVYVCL